MKVTLDIDCTPNEARAFFGLPDVKPLQEAMMKEVEARLKAGMETIDPESLFKTWMPDGAQGFGEMQKAFWGQMMGGKDKETS
jgi:hypothetical protein